MATDTARAETEIDVCGHPVRLTHPDRVLFPGPGLTKADLAHYYQHVARAMLPHLKGRPISLKRFPEGREGEGFFQKQAPDSAPEWIDRQSWEKEDGEVDHLVINSPADLVYLVQIAALEIHVGLARGDKPDRPDRLIFDLDPPSEEGFDRVRKVARQLRDALSDAGLHPVPMLTGSKGIHVVVPLDRHAGFDAVRDVAHRFAKLMADRHPETMTVAHRKEKRGDRVFLDYLRNAYGQTTIAPYSTRAKPGGPVAVPVRWSEIGRHGPRDYDTARTLRRLGQTDDPWGDLGDHARRITSLEKWLDREGG